MAIDAALGRLGIRPGVCTSLTRPANPFEGQVIYETDTNNIRFWSGSAWESNKGGIVSSSAPTGAAAGDIWYDSDDGRAYIYYDDGSSQQWVEFGAPPVQHGKILQVVSTTFTTAFTTTVDADVTGLSATITPTSASNSILVLSSTSYASTGTLRARLKLFRTIGGTSTNLIGTNGNPGSGFAFAQDTAYNDLNWHQVASFSHLDSPATTSAVTYNIRADSEAGATVYINQSPASTARGGVSTLTVMEVGS